jgi:hypothetical protein
VTVACVAAVALAVFSTGVGGGERSCGADVEELEIEGSSRAAWHEPYVVVVVAPRARSSRLAWRTRRVVEVYLDYSVASRRCHARRSAGARALPGGGRADSLGRRKSTRGRWALHRSRLDVGVWTVG